MNPLLDIRGLTLHYAGEGRTVHAVDDVSLTLGQAGEALGIVGESGSGKTSLATALMRLLPKNVRRFEGQMLLDGRDISALPEETFRREVRWREIAMVFQGAMNVLNPVLRIGEQIAEPLFVNEDVPRDAALKRAGQTLERVGLPTTMLRRYPHELSGGQKQRVVIACALVMEPRVLVLDEPSSSLDVSVQAQLMNLLKELKQSSGMGMIFITHDIGLASDLCEKIAVAYAGRHVETGTAERVLTRPEHPYTRLLLASLPRLRSSEPPGAIPGQPPDPAALPSGCRFHPRCPAVFAPCDTEEPGPLPAGDGIARCWLLDPSRAPQAHPWSVPAAAVPEVTPTTTRSPAWDGAPLVELSSASVIYRSRTGLFRREEVRAVDAVDLALHRGEVVAVVGESGSGKSTLGRATLRLVDLDHGSVRFDGRDITKQGDDALGWFRRRAQVVFQDPFSSLNPYARIGSLVEEPLLIDGIHDANERAERVVRALEAVQLAPGTRFTDRYPTQLSGGQRQRVGIARAIVREPEYLVADEPVSMIDASSRVEILAVLRRLQRERGLCLLYITHDIASSRFLADRIAVMHAGRIVEMGTPDVLIGAAVHPYTKALIAAVPEPDPRNRLHPRPVVTSDPAFGSGLTPGAPLHPGCPHANHPDSRPDLLPLPGAPDHLIACHLATQGTSGQAAAAD